MLKEIEPNIIRNLKKQIFSNWLWNKIIIILILLNDIFPHTNIRTHMNWIESYLLSWLYIYIYLFVVEKQCRKGRPLTKQVRLNSPGQISFFFTLFFLLILSSDRRERTTQLPTWNKSHISKIKNATTTTTTIIKNQSPNKEKWNYFCCCCWNICLILRLIKHTLGRGPRRLVACT